MGLKLILILTAGMYVLGHQLCNACESELADFPSVTELLESRFPSGSLAEEHPEWDNSFRLVDRAGIRPGDRLLDIGPLSRGQIAYAGLLAGADVHVVHLGDEEHQTHQDSLSDFSRIFSLLPSNAPTYHTGPVQLLRRTTGPGSFKVVFLFGVLDIAWDEKSEILAAALGLLQPGGSLFLWLNEVTLENGEPRLEALRKAAALERKSIELLTTGIESPSGLDVFEVTQVRVVPN